MLGAASIAPRLWCLDITSIKNTAAESDLVWLFYMGLLTSTESSKVSKFCFLDDKKRALASIFLQKALTRQTFEISDSQYSIHRTRENKPYPQSEVFNFHHWNFNVSHHGKYVCIASQSEHLIGVDIVDISTRSTIAPAAADYVDMFSEQLDDFEVATILRQSSESARFNLFFIYWSLKEAFIKAIGQGLGYNLKNTRFTITLRDRAYQEDVYLDADYTQDCTDSTNQHCARDIYPLNRAHKSTLEGTAVIAINGESRHDWRFEFWGLDEKHVISVARGPLTDAIESYRTVAWCTQPVTSRPLFTSGAAAAVLAMVSAAVGVAQAATSPPVFEPLPPVEFVTLPSLVAEEHRAYLSALLAAAGHTHELSPLRTGEEHAGRKYESDVELCRGCQVEGGSGAGGSNVNQNTTGVESRAGGSNVNQNTTGVESRASGSNVTHDTTGVESRAGGSSVTHDTTGGWS